MVIDDSPDPTGQVVENRGPVGALTVHRGFVEAIGMMARGGQGPAFATRVALRFGVRVIASNRPGDVVLDRHHNSACGGAKPAQRSSSFDPHLATRSLR
jgi:hypothetical protein